MTDKSNWVSGGDNPLAKHGISSCHTTNELGYSNEKRRNWSADSLGPPSSLKAIWKSFVSRVSLSVISQQECTESYKQCERWRKNEDLQSEYEIRVEPHVGLAHPFHVLQFHFPVAKRQRSPCPRWFQDDWINSWLVNGLFAKETFPSKNRPTIFISAEMYKISWTPEFSYLRIYYLIQLINW